MKKCGGSSSDNGAMGLLLVLFPQDTTAATTTTAAATIADKSTKLNFPSSLLSKTQSTISICALLLFTTLLLFTLSSIPNNTPPSHRRFLLHQSSPNLHPPRQPFALQRMGTLFRRGSRPMPDLLVCHVSDDTSLDDFRFFLRLLFRSSLTASSDVVFIFASHSSDSKFATVVREENDAFYSLLRLNFTRFFLKGPKPGEPVWGKSRIESNFSGESLSYGSVLSFDASELDPENSLSGFLDRVPLSLRRWACYPMLLGRVRHSFKHVMLVDVKSVLLLKDPLGRVRNRGSDSVFLFAKTQHGKKSQSQSQTIQNAVLPAVVMGGARGVRRFSNAVLVEIVRAAIQHKKKKNSVSESAVLSQLVGNEFMLRSKNVNLIASTESIPEASQLAGHNSDSATWFSGFAIIQRGVSNHDLNAVIKKQLCSSIVDSSVYRDC